MNVAFYFPYPTVGGVSILFLRCAEYLSKKHKVFIVDLNNGYMANNIPSGCTFVCYDQVSSLPDDVVVLTQSCPLWRIPFVGDFPANAKIMFWNLHPDNFNSKVGKSSSYFMNSLLSFLFKGRKRKLRKLVSVLNSNNALFFMDKENKLTTENSLDINLLDPVYLPITNSVKAKSKLKYIPPRINEEINCIVVGRLSGFKVSIVKHVIKRLELCETHRVHLTVVGDGEAANDIQELLSSCRNIRTTYIDYVHFEELDGLFKNSHLAFAMGTSALDSASLGIPTICLDYSHEDIDGNYKFNYLYGVDGYNLGRKIVSDDFIEIDNLPDVINDIYTQGLSCSEKTHRYYLENHSYKVIEKLESYLSNGVLVKDLIELGLNQEDWFTRIIIELFNKSKVDDSGFIKV